MLNPFEASVLIEKSRAFVGDQRLQINKILCDNSQLSTLTSQHHLYEDDKISRILRSFERDGCQREKWPLFVVRLEDHYVCLDGKHRLEAAKIYLSSTDQWWRALVFSSTSRQPIKQMSLTMF